MTPVDRQIRGKLGTIVKGRQREHSRKPDEAYDYISKLYPLASKLDVFSRENRIGWSCWGDEVGKFNV